MPFYDQWRSDQHTAELADAITYGNGRFVMVDGERSWWSDDGRVWSASSADLCLHAVTFGDGHFVAVGDRSAAVPLTDWRQMGVAVSSDGENWITHTIPELVPPDELGLCGIGYGEGLFVAVGTRGRVYTSSEPSTLWHAQRSTTTTDLRGVGYGGGRFVAVGGQGTVLISEDQGLTWMAVPAQTKEDLVGLAFGMGTFIVVGRAGTLLRSQDRGSSWELRSLVEAGDLCAIAHGHEAFVVAGDLVLASKDAGETWLTTGLGEGEHAATPNSAGQDKRSSSFTGIAFGQHRFVAVGPHGQLLASEQATAQLKLQLSSQPDKGEPGAETELLLTVDNAGPDLAPGLYADLVLQGDYGIAAVLPSRGSYAMVNSTTLRYGVGTLHPGEQATAKVVLLPQSRGLIELNVDAWADVFSPGPGVSHIRKFIPIEAPPPRPIDRWQPCVVEPDLRSLRAAAYGNGVWIAAGDNGLIMRSIDNGESWVIITPVVARSFTAMAHTPDGFMVVGEQGAILSSSDGEQWQAWKNSPAIDLHGVAAGPNCMVAVGDGGTIFTKEYGEGDWMRALSPTSQRLRAVTCGGHHFTAVGDQGTVLESPDGWSWSLMASVKEADLCGVVHGQGNTVIIAVDGSILTPSAAGWQKEPCGDSQTLYAVCHGGEHYLTVGGIFTSSTGHGWQECNVGQIGPFYGCAYGNGSFVVVGPKAMIMQSLPVVPAADLSLAMHCAPEVRRGQLLRSHLTVTNHGPALAPQVVLTALVPPGAAFAWVNAVHGQCRQIGDAVYCELGDLHPEAVHAVVIGLKALENGLLTIHGVVSHKGLDPDLTQNHTQCHSQVVTKGPTLTIDQRVTREQGMLRLNVKIKNEGPGVAYEVALTNPLPQGTHFLSASTSQGLFVVPKHKHHGTVLCQIGTMEAGETVVVRLLIGIDDKSLRKLTNTIKLEASNAKSVSSSVRVKLK